MTACTNVTTYLDTNLTDPSGQRFYRLLLAP
jgi:hypothetical protein